MAEVASWVEWELLRATVLAALEGSIEGEVDMIRTTDKKHVVILSLVPDSSKTFVYVAKFERAAEVGGVHVASEFKHQVKLWRMPR